MQFCIGINIPSCFCTFLERCAAATAVGATVEKGQTEDLETAPALHPHLLATPLRTPEVAMVHSQINISTLHSHKCGQHVRLCSYRPQILEG